MISSKDNKITGATSHGVISKDGCGKNQDTLASYSEHFWGSPDVRPPKSRFASLTTDTRYVQEGSLDYDARSALMDLNQHKYNNFSQDISSYASTPTPAINIRMIFPTRDFERGHTEFAKRHESMQQDADEHFNLLVQLQHTDKEFEQYLVMNHHRKARVDSVLREWSDWSKLTAQLGLREN